MAKPSSFAPFLILLAVLAPAPALHASDESDRGWQELREGNLSRARWLFEQALKLEPCDAWSLKGYARAGGDVEAYKRHCPDAATADSGEEPQGAEATEAPTAEATPSPAAVEAGAVAPDATGADSATDAGDEDDAVAADEADATGGPEPSAPAPGRTRHGRSGSRASHGRHAAGTADRADGGATPAAAGVLPGDRPFRELSFRQELHVAGRWFKRILAVIAAAFVALAAVLFVRFLMRLRSGEDEEEAAHKEVSVPPSLVKLVAQHDAAFASAAAAERAASQAQAQAQVPAAPLPPSPPPAPTSLPRALETGPAPAPRPSAALPQAPLPQALDSGPALPFGPSESLRLSLKAGGEQAHLTDKKFYWSGERRFLGLFKTQAAPLTLAVPFAQITGVAWARPKGGDLLVIGTLLAGDVALKASLFGAVPLQSFAQALSEAMDREA
jgi:hypothetical protein